MGNLSDKCLCISIEGYLVFCSVLPKLTFYWKDADIITYEDSRGTLYLDTDYLNYKELLLGKEYRDNLVRSFYKLRKQIKRFYNEKKH